MSNTQKAKQHGISRQTYEFRVKNWVKFVGKDGKEYLINPKQMMELKEMAA